MNKWYRKAVVKAVVLIVGVLSGASFLTSLAVGTTLAGTVNPAEIMTLVNQTYEESGDFQTSVANAMSEVFRKFRLEDFFEMDGAYNPEKVIDVMEYYQSSRAEGDNPSGVAYTLGDLVEWGEDFSEGSDDNYSDNEVVVCQKPDGDYYYYYLDEFLALFRSGGLVMEFNDEYMSQELYLQELENGAYTSSGAVGGMKIHGQDGSTWYTDCWNYGKSLREDYVPQGAENLLQVVNSSAALNGKLTTVYEALEMTLAAISTDFASYQSGWDYLEEGNTNLTYLYINTDTKKVESNKSEYNSYEEAEQYLKEMKSGDNVKYMFVYPQLKDFETNMNVSASGEWEAVKSQETGRKSGIIFAAAIDTSYPIQDQFYEGKINYDQNIPFLRYSIISLAVGALLFLVSAVWLAFAAGKRPEDEELHLAAFDRWKTEIAAAVVILLWGVVTWIAIGGGYVAGSWQEVSTAVSYYTELYGGVPQFYSALFTNGLGLADITSVFMYGVFTFLCFFWGYTSLVRRIKAKSMWKGSLLCAVISFGRRVMEAWSVTARAGVILLAFLFILWLAILAHTGATVILALAASIAAAWFVLSSAMAKSRIRKGIEEIASGNLEHRIELNGLRGADKELAEKVNDIGSGLNRAVDEAMRNERLKTDLITNVSHDIKTPLTSIINYVDILKRSNIADEKIRGYLDILEAKAQRLKTLTEDVVEASKVSSGNITLEYMDMDLRELIQQTEGELAEKFAARRLTVVLNMPEEPAVIHVDGRRMWRVLENIFGNAAKYAMPGTRVYADLTLNDSQVMFSLKNVSEQQLNFSADELTERFIRGDISRSTEGSGLGLSIAKSLTTMQGGEFELYLDGDLFRVNIRFPRRPGAQRAKSEEAEEAQ
ncbi:MAG TPA: sensor histidine kinase [Candidatus Mediterraneibacter stercorigallinarum]|uniref:histidine kinase n=1 Tax=Candidatus Mediterraneibacter stercorigallinarum TaxID=2838686 RepID=A0A9D2D9S0_9FIRM|nr:sensor histidine kinase [Candidatus Mediterraneibacter stercorigallinarum]